MIAINFRYPGVQPFSKAQKDQFFGRDDDCERLLDLIFLEKLTVLFGKSGYGKSSLLNAAILPRLEEETAKNRRHYVPVTVRFNLWMGGQDSLLQKFMFHVSHTLEPLRKNKVARVIKGVPDTLWSQLKFADVGVAQSEGLTSSQTLTLTNYPVTFVLIFDQFEEFFSYPHAQQQDFKRQLAELLYADVPTYLKQNEDRHTPEELAFLYEKMDVKVILSIRADRLSDLDRLKDKLPAILHKRYELRALSREQAREALEKPALLSGDFRSPAFNWQPETTERILQELSSDNTGRSSGVEAFQLQILAQNIESLVIRGDIKDRNGDGRPDVFPDDLPADLSNIYAEYYRNKIADLPAERQLVARKLVEDGLVFTGEQGEARRLSMDGDVLRQQFGADEALLKSLEDTFLVRREVNSLGGWNYELSHDTLVKPVVQAREIRRAEEEQLENERRTREAEAQAAKERRRRQRANALSFVAVLGLLIAAWQYWDADNSRDLAEDRLREVQLKEDQRKAAERDKEEIFMSGQVQYTENFLLAGECRLARQGLDTLIRLLPNHATFKTEVDRIEQRWKAQCGRFPSE
ncbi:MAG: hypothetical protein H7246_12355 [Phycisphaerae bacterium]|nr:hypothetical protein [Saprospiraceae bacterium]